MVMSPQSQANSFDYDQENGSVHLSPVEESISTSRSSGRPTEADEIDDNRDAANIIRLLRETEGDLACSESERREFPLQDNKRGAYHRGNDFGAVEEDGKAEGEDIGRSWRTESLMPTRLLSERNVRGILFSYGLISVSAYVASHSKIMPDW